MSEAVSLHGVMKNYGKHEVLKDVNFTVEKGDVFGIIGKNGCGKTTMFKIILGLSEYQQGMVKINDSEDLSSGRSKMGFFIGANFFPYMSARENLKYHCDLKNIKDKSEVDRVLEIVGLAEAKGPYQSYSLGMKQRLGIAKAILGNPEILILDEPTNGLDPQGIIDVRELIRKFNEEFGMTVIVSSHMLGELQNTCHKFGIVHDGQIAKVITQEDLLKTNTLIKISDEDKEKARQVLVDAGINVVSLEKEQLNLEDFYFETIKGE